MKFRPILIAAALTLGTSGAAQADVGCCILNLNKGTMCLTTSVSLCKGSPRFQKHNGWQYCVNPAKGPTANCQNKKEGEEYEAIAKEQSEMTEQILMKLREASE